jgi:RHS repeat-associated protein
VADPLAELKGFKIAGAFGYDGNGNFTSDGDQGLAIVSNLINLPRIVASPSDSLLFEYTFGGEKIRKLQTSPVVRDRIYLGGAEFVNDTLELYHHAEGRVVLSGVKPAFQYRIADHLGNTVVFFEDRDGDTQIKTESMTSDPDSLEVLQRNYYYPFGLEMEGTWQATTAPRADYLYNGKEFNEDLGLNWYDYGARYYDPSIGRWNGVDPLASEAPEWTPYRYAFDNPISFFDPDGMFEDEAAAQKYAKDQGIKIRPKSSIGRLFTSGKRSEIVGQSDGTFAIENRRENTSTFDMAAYGLEDMGVRTTSLNKATDVMDLAFDENGSATLTLRDGSIVEGYAGPTYIGGTAPTPGLGRVKKGMTIWNIAKKKIQKGGTFLPKKYLELFKKGPKTDFSKTSTSTGSTFEPALPNTQPRSKWKHLLDTIFGNFDDPRF